MHAGTNIPPLFAMISKGRGAIVGSNINNDSCTKGGKGGAVEVKLAQDLVVSGEFGVDPGGPEQVECDDGLWEKLIPETSRESLISSVQNGSEVIFKSADSTLRWIVTVVMESHQLVFEVLLFNFVEEVLGGFIVQALVDGGNAGLSELLVAGFLPKDEIVRFPAFNWASKDSIGVIVVEEEDVVVSKEGLKWELTRKVSCNQAFQLGGQSVQREGNGGDEVALLQT